MYVTTNEYDLFGPAYNAAQIFAFSKAQLAAHPATINVTLVENLAVDGSPGFTVWPATSPAGQYSTERNGTEYFLSTIAGDGFETGNPTGTARRIGLWALTNTKSLDTATPALGITSRLINSETYVFPPKSDQKPGDIPLGECINNTTTPTLFGPGCWQLLFVDEPAHNEVESHLDSNDTRMQQTWYVNGQLWGAAGHGRLGQRRAQGRHRLVRGRHRRSTAPARSRAQVKKQGYIALADNNLTYPAIAMGANGKGVIAFTVVGETYYPSAGYATINASGSVGPIHIAAAGPRARRRVHELQGVRRRSAADALGRLRRRRHRRQLDLDRLRVHRPDLHLRSVLSEPTVDWPTSAAAARLGRHWGTGPPASAS